MFSLVWNWEKMAYLQLLRGKAWDFKAFEDLSSTNDSSIFGTFCLVMNTLLSSACLLVYRWKLVASSLQSAYQNCKTGHWDSRFLPSYLVALSIQKGVVPVQEGCRAEADYYHVRRFVFQM